VTGGGIKIEWAENQYKPYRTVPHYDFTFSRIDRPEELGPVSAMDDEMLGNRTGVAHSTSFVGEGDGDKPAHPNLMQGSKTKDGGTKSHIWRRKYMDRAVSIYSLRLNPRPHHLYNN
jgi:hypothetical protein